MERHHRGLREVVAVLCEDVEDFVFAFGISVVRFQHQCEWSETIAPIVSERRVYLHEETDAGSLQSFASAHDDTRRHCCSMLVQPASALELSLEHGAIEGVLEISRA